MTGRVETGRIIERYEVEGELGTGGMASVYLLRHRHLGTLHALKVLTTMGPNAELRLLLEGRVQAALRHPNIVAVTDILDVDGSPGLLMEYVPPPSLAVWLAGHQPTVEEAESLFRGIVEGVRHAHRYGLVHRDLKPSNVLLARYDDEGLVPKVADFGLAKVLSGDHVSAGQTRSGLTMGTPQYMAPEQFRDAKKVDRRADMFSLGCVLYELLAGRPAFEWSDLITLYNQIAVGGYQPLPAATPQRLVDAVTALLQPERDARLPDCEALVAVLDGKGVPVGITVTPENLGRLVDVPMLRDRIDAAVAPKPPAKTYSETLVAADSGPPDTIVATESLSPAPARRSWGLPVGVAGALGVVGVLAWAATRPSGESGPALVPASLLAPLPAPVGVLPSAEVPAVQPEAAAAPSPSGPMAAKPLPAAMVEAQPAPTAPSPVVPSHPSPEAALPIPAVVVPVVAESTAATVGVEGDASRVVAVGEGGSFPLPGELQPGSYDVFAWFPESPRTKTVRLTVAAGERLSLRCASFSLSCARR